jgi:two-component system cell cycle response regulator CpdR
MTTGLKILRVLVADDDPSMRLVLTMAFERRGHAVEVAANTDVARRMLREGSLDVALIDAGMPRGGTSFWRECMETSRPPGGALLLTGDVNALGELARHPSVLAKPFDFGELIERVERMGGIERPEESAPDSDRVDDPPEGLA